jgi:hypothetical protein
MPEVMLNRPGPSGSSDGFESSVNHVLSCSQKERQKDLIGPLHKSLGLPPSPESLDQAAERPGAGLAARPVDCSADQPS